MLISICIPTYNGGIYLSECLKSVCQQSFTDFEILICDDHSTDNTIEIIKQFQEKDSRIKLFGNEKNLGLVGNWNRCIVLAQGDWIKFVFQDDIITPLCIQNMVEAIDDSIELIVCEREYIFEEGILEDIKKEYNKVPRMYQIISGTEKQYISAKQTCSIINKHLPSNFIGEPTSIMFKKSLIKEIGFFNSKIIQLCDFEYCLRIAVRSGFVYISDKLVHFRVHNSSTSQKNNTEKYFAAIYSDRIILMNLLLFDSHYINYRKYSSFWELFNLRYTLFYIIYHANLFAEKNGPAIKQEMKLLKENYPRIKYMQSQYFLFAPISIATRPFRIIVSYIKHRKKKLL